MRNIQQWIYSSVLVVLLVLAIDLNTNWRRWPAPGGLSLYEANAILGGLLILLILITIIKKPR